MAKWRKGADREQFPFTVADLAANYIDWADGYFTKHGEPKRHATNIRACAKLLLQQHRHTLICEFTAPVFGDWLDSLDGTGDRRCKHQNRLISRQYINKVRTAVLRMFQWGVRKGMVAPNHPEGLREIPGLAKGHTRAPDAPKVEPVETADVDAILPFLRPPVRAIVELMRLTGMRPGEAMVLRPCDVTIRADGVMVYRPHRHKLEHHDIERLIFVGPRAADVLRPFLDRDPESCCFSPREAVADLRVEQRKNRKSKVQPSQLDRRKVAPKRTARDRYDKDSLAQASRRACLTAGVPVWKPNQLRHAPGRPGATDAAGSAHH